MTPDAVDHDDERSAMLDRTGDDEDGIDQAEAVDEGRIDVDEPARDVSEVAPASGAAAGLTRVAQSLSRVAEELDRGTEQLRAAPKPKPAAKPRKPAVKKSPPKPPQPPVAAEPEPPVVVEPPPVAVEPEPHVLDEPEPLVSIEPEPDDETMVLSLDDLDDGEEIAPVAAAPPVTRDPHPPSPQPPSPIPEPHRPDPTPPSPSPGPHEPEPQPPSPRPEPHRPDPVPPPLDVAPPPSPWIAPTPKRPAFRAPEIEEFVFAENRAEPAPPAHATQPVPAQPEMPVVRGRPDPLPARPDPAGNLSKRKLAALRAFCDALLPAGGDLAVSARETGVAERIDAAMPHLDPAVRRKLERLIGLVDRAPIPTRGRRLSKLPPETAAAFIERALTGRNPVVRQALALLKTVVANEFCSTPQVEQAIGYTYSCETTDPVRAAAPLEVIEWPAIDRDHVEECDVVVVGSGAGGSAVAKELAEAGLSVIVVEEGAHFTRTDFAGPPWERVRRMYRANGTTLAVGRPLIPIPTGKAVGGTTLVNSGTCFRTPDRVLDTWGADFGIEGIDPASMKPIFDRVERILHVKPVPEEVIGQNARVFRRGVKALGLNGAPLLRNISGCRGCGVCAFGCPSDAKQSTNLSYLPRAQRAGATIYARCAVERVVVTGGRAAGIEAGIMDNRGRRVATLRVRSQIVVLSAGALHTPALLEASALANRSGHLGKHLRIHPAAGVGAIFEEPVNSWRGTLQSYMVDHWHVSDDTMIEVTSAVPGVSAGSLPGAGEKFKNMLARFPYIATAGLFVSDTSQGRVRRRRHGEPLVTYRLNDDDTRKIVAGMARIADIFLAAGAKAVFTGLPSIPWVTGKDDADDLREEAVKRSALRLTAFHPVGTVRMGADPAESVLDPWGECHDVPGLFVADASMLPGCPTVNPQVTIMAFATRTAAHVLRDRAAYFR